MRNIGIPEFLVGGGIFVVVPLIALTVFYLMRRLQSQERLRAIEKGVTIPVARPDPWERATRTREGGIILVAIGLGLFLLVAASTGMKGYGLSAGAGVGATPFLMGLGLLLSYRLRVRDLKSGRPQSPNGVQKEG